MASTTSYVALLRGINVGGRNRVPMAELRDALERAGHRSVRTYIQSGNVVFETDAARGALEADIEAVLEERFGFPIPVVVRSHRQMRAVVRSAPAGFGASDEHLDDVIFLKAPLTPATLLRSLEPREGVDRCWSGTGVVYFSRLSEKKAQTRLTRIVSMPEYQLMTIRNWRTTTTLLAMLEE